MPERSSLAITLFPSLVFGFAAIVASTPVHRAALEQIPTPSRAPSAVPMPTMDPGMSGMPGMTP